MSRSFWKRRSVGSTLHHENSLQHLANVLRSTRPRSGAGPPSSKYTRSRSVRKEKEVPVGLIAERAGLPYALSSSISPPPPTADARVSARSKPDGGGDVSGDGSRIRPRAESQFYNLAPVSACFHFICPNPLPLRASPLIRPPRCGPRRNPFLPNPGEMPSRGFQSPRARGCVQSQQDCPLIR
jgi:hypothetical protein